MTQPNSTAQSFGDQLDIDGGATPHEDVVGHVHPGDTCPTCARRVPHPKKAGSPTSKVHAYRTPLDEADAHGDVIDAVAELLGVKSEPFHKFKTISYALACVLQGARMDEKGE